MIDEGTLLGLASRFSDQRQLEKDYLLTLLLHEIYSVFGNDLIFKGGTSLKYFYNLNRFSEDLDFSYTGQYGADGRRLLYRKLNSALDSLSLQYEVIERERRGNKFEGRVIGVNFEVRVQGPLNGKLGRLQNIKLDISTRQDVMSNPDTKYLLPIYPDIATFTVPVMSIEEIAAEKIASIFERDKLRDIYDVYFLLLVRGLRYNESMVAEKMSRRKEIFDKEKLLSKINGALDRMKWRSELFYLVNPLPDSKVVVESLERALNHQQ